MDFSESVIPNLILSFSPWVTWPFTSWFYWL